jgi:hypothetical protein
MTLDPAIEAVARELFAHDQDPILWCDHTDETRNNYREAAVEALTAAAPLILEKAAKALECLAREERNLDAATLERAAARVRALKEQP